MPEHMPEDMPEHLPEDMPEHLPEDMPGRMPEDMPDRMPDRMPENMSDRMPEDLPVTKCINVMVGITRSKVFFFSEGACRASDIGFLCGATIFHQNLGRKNHPVANL